MNQETIERAARAIRDTVRISIRPDGGTMELLEHGHTFHLTTDEANTAARAAIAAIHPIVSSVEELDAHDAEVAAKAKIELLNELSREALPDQAIRYIASDDVTPSTGHINSWLWMRAAGIEGTE